ncbi:hypothetical protein ABIB06_006860 [Bradyrhizobium sp. LB8.2]|uniref:hypothetical protein n=1 Tax=unclassified Bradyrhizobium TaxID=2631580 RepID=UPI003393B26F
MNSFQTFLIKAADLYLSAPVFFNWVAGIVATGTIAVVWFAYWLGGKLSEGVVAELKGKVEVLEQRFGFAKDRADAAAKEAADTKTDFEKLKQEIANQAPRETLQNSAAVLEINFDRLLSANNSTSSVLGYVSTGFDKGQLKWRPIGEDEKHLLAPHPEGRGTLAKNEGDN